MADSPGKARIALVSPGAMGAAMGARLVDAGHAVLTALADRSEASRARAREAGMTGADDDALAACDIILSIMPPANAGAFVERMLPHIAARRVKPLFVDANALGPATKKALAARLASAGCAMVDGAILGPPPRAQGAATTLLLSGDAAAQAMILATDACPAKCLAGGIGAAAAVKMCFAGINKGLTGLAATMLLAAERHGAGDALRAELRHGLPHLVDRFGRQVPDMIPKAYRWVAEMEEISAFLAEGDPAGAEIFRGMAALYRHIARDLAGDGHDIAALVHAVRPE